MNGLELTENSASYMLKAKTQFSSLLYLSQSTPRVKLIYIYKVYTNQTTDWTYASYKDLTFKRQN